jgi:folate-dependent phosphoribosylglycinamide formyltransferase PurN
MSKEIVILTRDSWRHRYIRNVFGVADGIEVLRTYCETSSTDLLAEARAQNDPVRVEHLEKRARSEHDFFAPFVNSVPDYSNSVEIPDGSINNEEYYEEIVELDPDLLVAYGCSIVEDPLLSEYEGQFLNCHLGLSPYYRGTGTNFWPLVNGEPEYVGATFMHLAEGIDTGEIIHQLRARVYPADGPHDIGNRLIADAGQLYPEIVRRFDDLHTVTQLPEPDKERYYRSADYNPDATRQLYENFADGMIAEYLDNQTKRIDAVPIVKNPAIEEDKVLSEPDI